MPEAKLEDATSSAELQQKHRSKEKYIQKNIKKRREEEVPGNSCTICENVF